MQVFSSLQLVSYTRHIESGGPRPARDGGQFSQPSNFDFEKSLGEDFPEGGGHRPSRPTKYGAQLRVRLRRMRLSDGGGEAVALPLCIARNARRGSFAQGKGLFFAAGEMRPNATARLLELLRFMPC